MKKLLLIISAAFILTSCGGVYPDRNAESDSDNWSTVTYDKHEYVKVQSSGLSCITHKANCKSCEEKEKAKN